MPLNKLTELMKSLCDVFSLRRLVERGDVASWGWSLLAAQVVVSGLYGYRQGGAQLSHDLAGRGALHWAQLRLKASCYLMQMEGSNIAGCRNQRVNTIQNLTEFAFAKKTLKHLRQALIAIHEAAKKASIKRVVASQAFGSFDCIEQVMRINGAQAWKGLSAF